MNQKRDRILKHTARYGLTLRPVLDRLYYDGVENGCERDVTELRKDGLLDVAENSVEDKQRRTARFSYYHLTRKATALLGVPESRGKKPGPEAVTRNLAILWYCTMRPERSYRLERAEVADLLSSPSGASVTTEPSGYHCLSLLDRYRLLQIYVPTATVPEIMNELRKRIGEARRNPALKEAMWSGQYGFLVLVESLKLRDELRNETRKLTKEAKAKIIVSMSPGPWK